MMWALAIKSKLTAALLLGVVLGIVILTNFSERSSSKKINIAIASIYEDRLVVEGYIFDYAHSLRQIEEIAEDIIIHPDDKKILIAEKLEGMKKLHTLYSATKLTDNEKVNFDRFTQSCNTLKAYNEKGRFEKLLPITGEARNTLNILSSIQMSEAKLQMENVSKISSLSNIISQFEMIILIVIAIIVQILVFSSNAIAKAKIPENVHLN